MEVWALVFLFGVLVEAIVQIVKSGVPDTATTPGWLWPIVSSVIGVAMSVTAHVGSSRNKTPSNLCCIRS